MSAPFKVGEIVIGQNFIFSTELNGMEAEIIGGLEWRKWDCAVTGVSGASWCYDILWANGDSSFQGAEYLRRRKPPTTGEESVILMFTGSPHRQLEPA